jgi:hypothetical protein
MEVITFRCATCNQVLKVGADKAGRKAKCKCGAEVTIPQPQAPAPPAEEEGGTYGMVGDFTVAPKAEEKPTTKRGRRGRDEEDEGDTVVRTKDLEAEEEARPREKRKRAKAPKVRALLEPGRWKKVCLGLNLISIGLWVWLGAVVVREVVVAIGVFNSPEYARLRLRWQDPKHFADLTNSVKEDITIGKAEFMLGLVSGSGPLTAGKWLFILSAVILIGAHGTLLAGYGRCLAVPPRYGARGQVWALLILGSLNVLCALIFRLLPFVGAMDYLVIPVALPELALLDANLERELCLSVALSPLPGLDYVLGFLILGCYFFEMVVLAVFLRSIALAMHHEKLEPIADGMIRLSLGTAFIHLSYTMLMIAGGSDVLTMFLRLLYLLGLGFLIGQLIWFAMAVLQVPPLIEKELDESEEAAVAVRGKGLEEEEDEDEEDEDEDEEDEDEDEDDD